MRSQKCWICTPKPFWESTKVLLFLKKKVHFLKPWYCSAENDGVFLQLTKKR